MTDGHKATIETIINTAAIALTATGTTWIINNTEFWRGFILILFGIGLEFFKYWGRDRKLW